MQSFQLVLLSFRFEAQTLLREVYVMHSYAGCTESKPLRLLQLSIFVKPIRPSFLSVKRRRLQCKTVLTNWRGNKTFFLMKKKNVRKCTKVPQLRNNRRRDL